MPKRSCSACSSIQNLGIHAIQQSSGTSETAEVELPAFINAEEVEYVGYMPQDEIWEDAEVLELAGDDLKDDEENRAKGGAAWMMLAKGLADWEAKKKANINQMEQNVVASLDSVPLLQIKQCVSFSFFSFII
jgi:hypothetical protein